MRLSFLHSPVLLALAAVTLADGTASDTSDVLKLTADTFQSSVDNNHLMLVEFFAPWYSSTNSSQISY